MIFKFRLMELNEMSKSDIQVLLFWLDHGSNILQQIYDVADKDLQGSIYASLAIFNYHKNRLRSYLVCPF